MSCKFKFIVFIETARIFVLKKKIYFIIVLSIQMFFTLDLNTSNDYACN